MIRKIAITIICIAVSAIAMMGQAKKPTIMVVPSDAWCNANGFVQAYDDLGTPKTLPDYKSALSHNMDLKLVIAKLNELMADRGFPLKDLEATMSSLERSQAEEMVLTSKTSGSQVSESLLDRVRRVAKADIIIEIGWEIKTQGPRNTLTYIMRGLDSYSNKQVAGSSGASSPSISADIAMLLEEAVLSRIDEFNSRLQEHFEDMFTNGREVALDLRVFDNGSGIDFEKEYGDYELCELIDEWMDANTVMGRYSKLDATETRLSSEQ
ncbi:MAG: DUF6175 family protein, partial [Candidatus Cryptobacteroides sp.]